MNTEKQKVELEIAEMVLSTYNKIAIWNNSDFDNKAQRGDALKIVSQDIVQTILEQLASNMGVEAGVEVFRGDVVVSDKNEVNDKESFLNSNESDVFNKLFINKENTQ